MLETRFTFLSESYGPQGKAVVTARRSNTPHPSSPVKATSCWTAGALFTCYRRTVCTRRSGRSWAKIARKIRESSGMPALVVMGK